MFKENIIINKYSFIKKKNIKYKHISNEGSITKFSKQSNED